MAPEEQLKNIDQNDEYTNSNEQTNDKEQINNDEQTNNRGNISKRNGNIYLQPHCKSDDRNLLNKFRDAVSALKFNSCSVCKESFPTIVLVQTTGLCNRCNKDKWIPRRFSAENDMDPGEIPIELPQLSQIEEMLIAQILLILTNPNDTLNASDDYIKHTFIPNPATKETEEVTTYIEINQLANTDTNTLIDWPTIKDSPINKFEEVSYITKAFSTLFPKGKADLHMLENGKIYVRQNLEDAYLTVEDIQELLNTNNSLVNQIVCLADLHWPDLHNLMPNTSVSSTQATQYHNLNENPHIATWFFTCRFELFLEHVLIPKWNLSDYWYR
ncbi:12_t:CDS:2, partial [Cetraspora pellucida]